MVTAVSARETLGSMRKSKKQKPPIDVFAVWDRFEKVLKYMETRPRPVAKSESDLAEKLGWSRSVIARWRHSVETAKKLGGDPLVPDGWMLAQAADLIGVRAEWIRNGKGEMETKTMGPLEQTARDAMNEHEWAGVTAAEYDYVMAHLEKMSGRHKVKSFWKAKITELIAEARKPAPKP